MINKIHTLIIATCCMLLIFGLTSCDNDGYPLGDMYASTATVHKKGNGEAQYFTLDNGKTLFVAASATAYKPKYERVYINYTILGDNYGGFDNAIKLNAYFEDILTKPVIYIPASDKKLQDSIGHNQIKVESLTAKAGFITIRFGYNMGGKDHHLLNLVAAEESLVAQGNEPIKLKFRHNINKDEENYGSYLMHVSFKLDKYLAANSNKEKLTVEVSWDDYNGETKVVKLEHAMPKRETETPKTDTE